MGAGAIYRSVIAWSIRLRPFLTAKALAMLSTNHVEAERIRLRTACNADLEGIVELETDRRIRRYLGGPRLEWEVRDHLEAAGVRSVTAPAGSFIVADRATDTMLGTASLSRRGNDRLGHVDGDGEELELSYALRTCAWGFGYATEAVRALLRAAATELPDQPVLIVTQSAYSASLRVGERLGFAIVTTFEEFEAEQTLEAANLHTFRTGEVSRF